jgi:5-bromo-4-chloroindolyl phosphate hydrolysis protein
MHCKIKKQIKHAHSNIYNLLKHLKEIQSVNEATIMQQAGGGVRPPQRRKYGLINT